MTGSVPTQLPLRQLSVRVHALPSLQATPSAFVGLEHAPVAMSQVPTSWHWSCAVQTTGFAPMQLPPWQVSERVQASLSVHVEPSGFDGFEQVPVCVSHVPAT